MVLLKKILKLLKNKEDLLYADLIYEIKISNQLLRDIKELLLTNQIDMKIDNSKKISEKKKSKDYIPEPNISNTIVSNKKIKEENIENNDISDTLEILSKLKL